MSLQIDVELQAAGKHLFITECPWQSLLCAGDFSVQCYFYLAVNSH